MEIYRHNSWKAGLSEVAAISYGHFHLPKVIISFGFVEIGTVFYISNWNFIITIVFRSHSMAYASV